MNSETSEKRVLYVIPAKAGIQSVLKLLDSRFRGNDNFRVFQRFHSVRLSLFLLMCLALLFSGIYSWGCSSSSADPITVQFSPVEDERDVALDAAVTATFSAAPSSVPSLSTFTLTKNGSDGSPLCTDVAYSASSLTATCTHDSFELGGQYTVAVDGISGVTSNTASFYTYTTTISVSSLSKSSVTSISGNNNVTLAFGFDASVPSWAEPVVAVTKSSDDTEMIVGTCLFNTDRNVCSVIVSGVDGCNDYTDYSVSLSGGVFTSYATSFNSSDYEFDSGVLNSCWFGGDGHSGASLNQTTCPSDLSTCMMTDVVSNDQDPEPLYKTGPNISEDIAYSTYLPYDNVPPTCDVGSGVGSAMALISFYFTSGEESFDLTKGLYGGGGQTLDGWLLQFVQTSSATYAYPTSGSSADIMGERAPFYLCIVRRSGRLTSYASDDGVTYIRAAGNELTSSGPVSAENMSNFQTNALGAYNFQFNDNNTCDSDEYTAKVKYLRFKTTFDSDDSSGADCPPF